MSSTSRRQFLHVAAASGALLGMGDLGFLSRLRPVTAQEAELDPNVVKLTDDIEPLVRLLEETPRQRLLEEVAERINKGLSYREVLAALLLAGVRNVQPRPNVGFKFHAVLVVNSAHLASLASPDAERWLPIFWALDYFKDSQAVTQKESGWRMRPVNEARLPTSVRAARRQFTSALDNWDEEQADAAIAVLARNCGSNELYEIFCKCGARDFRSIGHKAIYVANAWRTLNCIGWHHAEPVLRSLTYALLYHDGPNPAASDLPPDRPGRRNWELAKRLDTDWSLGRPSAEATAELLATLRSGNENEAADQVLKLLQSGTATASIWDALFAGAAELLMRQPGIVALHAVTTTNALHHAFRTSEDDLARRWLLLQNAAFLPLFRQTMANRGKVQEHRIDQLEPAALTNGKPPELGEIFATLSTNRQAACQQALAYLNHTNDPKSLINAARLLVFLKGNDSHDYKFSSAVMEDCFHTTSAWRNRFLAASMVQLRGSGGADNPLVSRTRAALKT